MELFLLIVAILLVLAPAGFVLVLVFRDYLKRLETRRRLRQFRPLVSATIEPRDIVEMMRQNDEGRGNAA